MRSTTLNRSAGALLLLAATLVEAKHGAHEHLEALHTRHRVHRDFARSSADLGDIGVEQRAVEDDSSESELAASLEKRGQCVFPTDAGLVPVAMSGQNAGWAMSPDQPCTPGNYCPYACPPGQVSMQWDPSATSYSYPKSMNGGLFCDSNGEIQKPFPDKPYCQQTASNIGVQNNAGSSVSFCQTVLPGNEAMLIPTTVDSWAQLAVPDTSYWCGTAAHYYINPPGIDTDTACVWGTNANPWGNWSPYVAGANMDVNGNTFIKLGWNPIYLEAATPFRTTVPSWGVSLECTGGECNGMPCSINPSTNGVNEMTGSSSIGAGGAAFCVVTVPKGATANFVITGSGGSSSWSNSSSSSSSSVSTSTSSSSSSSSSNFANSWPSASAPWNAEQGNAGQFYGATSSAFPSAFPSANATSFKESWSHAYSPTTSLASTNHTSWSSPTSTPSSSSYAFSNHTYTEPSTWAATTSPTTTTAAATTATETTVAETTTAETTTAVAPDTSSTTPTAVASYTPKTGGAAHTRFNLAGYVVATVAIALGAYL